MSTEKRNPQFVVENGKPTAVILDIDQYEEMLERLEEADDIAVLKKMRENPLDFRPLETFLEEYKPGV